MPVLRRFGNLLAVVLNFRPALVLPMASAFQSTLQRIVHDHPVVRNNPYTSWFASAALSREEVARFTQQFSVFSHFFIEAQLRKVINSTDLASYHQGKEILLNELGVAFRPPTGTLAGTSPDEVSPVGTVDGATYRHASAHFEWLLKFAAPLGLEFGDLGKRRHALPSTWAFCEALLELYGSDDPFVSAGASYATEHWAAAGFWKELIQGLTRFKQASGLPLNLGFWVFHDRLEQQHADHTSEELAALVAQPAFDEAAFLRGASGILDALATFWGGLAATRTPPGKPAATRLVLAPPATHLA